MGQRIDMSTYDINFTFRDINFKDTEKILRDFLSKNRSQARPEWESRDNAIQIIPVDGYWDICSHADFVIDYNQQKLFLRARSPTFGCPVKDCIENRDHFGDRFIDYLIKEGINVK